MKYGYIVACFLLCCARSFCIDSIDVLPEQVSFLDETSKTIAGNIFSGDISPDEQDVIIVDGMRCEILKFNIGTGKLINSFSMYAKYSDYFYQNRDLYFCEEPSRFISVDSMKYEKHYLDTAKFNNSIRSVRYVGTNKIIALTSLHLYSIERKDGKPKYWLMNKASFAEFDKDLQLMKMQLLESNSKMYPGTDAILMCNDSCIIAHTIAYNDGKKPIWGLFDTNGRFIRNLAYMPEFFRDLKVGENYMNRPILTMLNNKALYSDSFDFAIRNVDSCDTMFLKLLDTCNTAYWYNRYLRTGNKALTEYYLLSMHQWDDTTLALELKAKSGHYILLYSTSNRLVNTYKLCPPSNQRIAYCFWGIKQKSIIAVVSDDEKYYFVKYKLDKK